MEISKLEDHISSKFPLLIFLDYWVPGPQFNAEFCSFADDDDIADSAFSFHKLFEARLLGCEVYNDTFMQIEFGFL